MTRIFTDGAEMGDTLFFNVVNVSTDASTLQKRSGGYCYRLGGTTTAKYITAVSEFYMRLGFKESEGAYHASNYFLSFQSAGTNIVRLRFDNTATFLDAYVSTSTKVADGIIPCAVQVWHLLEVYVKIADSEGRIVTYIDGNKDIDYTGDTKPGTDTTIDTIIFGNFSSTSQGGDIDDLAFNDTNNTDGKNDNSWCGDGYIVKLTPSGSGIHNDWLNSGSVSGSANYLYVDDFPANTTDYTYASASSTGLQTQFALTNPSLPPGSAVTRIYAEARAMKLSTNDYGIKLGELAQGGTDVVSGSRALYTSGFLQVLGNEAKTNPVSGSAWTTTDLDNLELVLEI